MSQGKSSFEIISEEINGWISADELRTLRQKNSGGSLADFSFAIKKAHKQKLHPFEDHVFFQANYDKHAGDDGREVLTLGVTIDGLRMIAQDTEEYAGQKGPFWCGKDGQWTDVWLNDEPPAAAKVGILRHSFKEPLWAVARWDDYAKTYSSGRKKGQPKYMWADMGPHMLAKCAEAHGLRRAFPDRTSRLYIREEMDKKKGPSRPTTDEDLGGVSAQDDLNAALGHTPDPNNDLGIGEPTDPEQVADKPESTPESGDRQEMSQPSGQGSNASETDEQKGQSTDESHPADPEPDYETISTESKDGDGKGQLGYLFAVGVYNGPYTRDGLKKMVEGEFGVGQIDHLAKDDFDAAKELLENDQLAKRYNDMASGKDQTRDMFDEDGEPATDGELDVRCDYCGAEPGEPCETESGNEKDGYHKNRTQRFKATAGNVEAFIGLSTSAIERAKDNPNQDPDDVLQSIAVEISSWPKEQWEQVVEGLSEVHDDAREKCDFRRAPEEFQA